MAYVYINSASCETVHIVQLTNIYYIFVILSG